MLECSARRPRYRRRHGLSEPSIHDLAGRVAGRTRLTTRLRVDTTLLSRGHPAVVPFARIEWKSLLEGWGIIGWIGDGFRGAGVCPAGGAGPGEGCLVLLEGPVGFVFESVVGAA